MSACFVTHSVKRAIPIVIVPQDEFSTWLKTEEAFVKKWLTATQFKNDAGSVSLIPNADGQIVRVICCVSNLQQLWGVGHLALTLPEGIYVFQVAPEFFKNFAIGWGLGAYQFTRYKKASRKPAQLVLTQDADDVINIVESIYFVRDLINTPTEDMGPSQLAAAASDLAKEYKAKITHIVGDDLLKRNYPLIHAVGRASDDAPRLIDFRWGNKKHFKLTLVGKGVCFDTGGLDIKPSSAMLLMKKDMGGAAHVLGLARMIMQAKLPICLRVLIPAVENSIGGNAYRPGDVLASRKGMTIEIGNTDAEGRLVLADALTEAVSENPDLLIDVSTLTGAARIALGTELPALFSNRDDLANDVIQSGMDVTDPVWRMPLFSLYRDILNSTVADINNCGIDSYGGAIIAGLFLKEFVPDTVPWIHYDLMAWNLKPRPGRPLGGEAMGLRGLFAYLIKKIS